MSQEHIARYRELFQELDVENGGTIGQVELKEMLRSVGQEVDPEELKAVVAEVHADGTGEYRFEEFIYILRKILEDGGAAGASDERDEADKPIVIGED